VRKYSVRLSRLVLAKIDAQARYIAVEAKAPLNARRWLQRIWDAVDSLAWSPKRAGFVTGGKLSKRGVRRMIVGRHLLLLKVDDERGIVWVVGLRHGHQRPRGEEVSESGIGAGYWPVLGERARAETVGRPRVPAPDPAGLPAIAGVV
jgi:plasmid stabilization system protein ParE